MMVAGGNLANHADADDDDGTVRWGPGSRVGQVKE